MNRISHFTLNVLDHVLEQKQAKHATGFKEAFIFLLNDKNVRILCSKHNRISI